MELIAKQKVKRSGRRRPLSFRVLFHTFLISLIAFSSSCTQLEKPEPEPFFAQTTPPKEQEFRWSNGKMPKSFDPALASAPPETDVVRAVYEGLTETDSTTLQEIPGVAESWSSSEDFKVWTFKLRKNAKWSNGKQVTAVDFVRAWKRLVKLGDKTAHRNLLSNIAGVPVLPKEVPVSSEEADRLLRSNSNQGSPVSPAQYLGQVPVNQNVPLPFTTPNPNKPVMPADDSALGFTAEDNLTLKVTLVAPDKDLPKLVANPIFRPIFSNGEEFIGKDLNSNFVSNGPFRITKLDATGLVLERSENYWNREKIRLERVHIVAMESSEKALAAYRAGELDAITNADFSPLVLKLLSPYEDFRKTTHSALNFYEVNYSKPPFSDRRVREALSNAIERDRLTEGEMEGQTRPALSFLPYSATTKAKLTQDKEKAKDLLEEAGFPNGEGFPAIRLLVNRNDTQQRVARSVARMWKQNLNLETDIVVKDTAELERMSKLGEFDLVRRGTVFPTSDETANFMAIFEPKLQPVNPQPLPVDGKPTPSPTPAGPSANSVDALLPNDQTSVTDPLILTEEDAIYELRAIPLYFPTAYSLVRPYVTGFEMNSLDALTLSNVSINSDWQPNK